MQNQKSPIRAVLSSVLRHDRSATTTVDAQAATVEVTLSNPAIREAPPRESITPAMHASPLLHTRSGRSAITDPKAAAGSAASEPKYPAARNSVKHRFDELKINFLAHPANRSVKSILFVGTSRGDGASTAAYNFAKSLAEDVDVRVLFINADLRAPAPHKDHSAADPLTGLASLAKSAGQSLLSASQDNFQVLPSGHNYADPAVLFHSKRFDAFLVHASQQFDYVVLDGPPLDEAPESISLSSKVDGVMLVIDAEHTRRRIALRAKKRIQEVGGNVVGLVLNRRKFYVPNWLYKLV